MNDKSSTTFPTETIAKVFQTGSFKSDSTRVGQDALKASGEYLRVFTREAIYRAQEKQQDSTQLEETHLEQVSGVLLLDF